MRQPGLELSDAEFAQVRAHARALAYDRYLAALLAPRPVRPVLVALAAFTGEIARIPLTVREPSLAEIRLEWWREAVGAFHDRERLSGNPVADVLGRAVRAYDLPRSDLAAIIDGAGRTLYQDGITDLTDFDLFLDETDGAAFRLAVRALGVASTPALDESSRAAGAAFGCMRLAASLARTLAHGRLPLAPETLAEMGDPRLLVEAEARSVARAIAAWLARKARIELALYRASCAARALEAMPAFLPLALIEPTLRALESPRHDVLTASVDIAPLMRVTRVWLAHWRGRV